MNYRKTNLIFKAFVRLFGHRLLTLGLLISGVVYFLHLAVLWIIGKIPPAPYMLWLPVLILAIPFLVNIITNLLTRRFAFTGNIIFHAGILIISAGVAVSYYERFEGNFILREGDTFFGEKRKYVRYSPGKVFNKQAPKISFRLNKIIPEFWENELHFTRLDAEVSYPATTLKNRGVIRINGGLKMDGARLSLAGFGYALNILTEDLKSGRVYRPIVILDIFPPGTEDFLIIKERRIYIKVLPDPVNEGGKLKNKSMNLVDPTLVLNEKRLGKAVNRKILKIGDTLTYDGIKLSFDGIKYWTLVNAVKDRGEPVIIAGLAALVAGLLLRLLPRNRN